MVGGKAAAEARAVTAGAVRCSAWLGPWSLLENRGRIAIEWDDALELALLAANTKTASSWTLDSHVLLFGEVLVNDAGILAIG